MSEPEVKESPVQDPPPEVEEAFEECWSHSPEKGGTIFGGTTLTLSGMQTGELAIVQTELGGATTTEV